MNLRYRLISFSIIAFSACCLSRSYSEVKIEKVMTYKQTVKPELFDNYRFATYFSSDKTAYNLRGFELARPGGKILSIKVNPAGYSYALLHGKGEKTKVSVYPINGDNSDRREVRGLTSPSAIAYTADSRKLIVADGGALLFFDSKTLEPTGERFETAGRPKELAVSPNGYFIASLTDDRADIINATTGALRTSLPASGAESVAFTGSGSKMGLLTSGGALTVYNTSDFMAESSTGGLGNTRSLFFHPDENYAGMVSDGNRIQFVNLFDAGDRPVVYESGVGGARFLRDGKDNIYLADFTDTALRYRLVSGFTPNYSNLLNRMVEERMNEWMKMRPGETELEYRERVNEESIRQQRIRFNNEAATELALTAGLGNFGEAVLGRYNPENGTLIISLPGLPDIYLTVPPEDMAGFGDGNNLQYSEPVYTITPANTFELLYVSVFNPTNGKTYVFDNLENQNLDFLALSDGFVSLDLIMQSSREDVELKSIKDRIMEEARQKNLLSDHTTINVESHIEQAVDATGKRVRNYHVNFAYQVSEEGSAKEDFAPGRYRTSDSHAAASMLRIIGRAFRSEFAGYLKSGKGLIIEITGSADALPINGSIAYDSSLGEFTDEPCYIDGSLTTLTVTPQSGMKTNEQLAFMRARAVQDELERLVPDISTMDVTYRHNIEVSKEKGARFRRIAVSLIFIDAF